MVKRERELLAHRPREVSLKAFEGNRNQKGIKDLNRRGVQKGGKKFYTRYNILSMAIRNGIPSQEWYKPKQNPQLNWEILYPKVVSKVNILS